MARLPEAAAVQIQVPPLALGGQLPITGMACALVSSTMEEANNSGIPHHPRTHLFLNSRETVNIHGVETYIPLLKIGKNNKNVSSSP